ncbi:hypothetical protein BpHYR1_028122 [Brachionus plicatilis]|uniref:Uncharacterized protein n=1 Tax=Brachionus plicatilis TaxID=10195 RepID=A0A3M7SLC1_BRAPC|nr:hypothetical protein BpHYR1_028122 [Brachionus plicatilis]
MGRVAVSSVLLNSDHPDDYGDEKDSESHIGRVVPLKTGVDPSHCIANNVVIKKCANQRTMEQSRNLSDCNTLQTLMFKTYGQI